MGDAPTNPISADLLRRLRDDVDHLNAAQGWQRNVEQRTLYLTSEVGELAHEILRLTAPTSGQDRPTIEELHQRIGAELYDVLWNLCDLARQLGIDLDDAATQKAARNRSRTW